MRTSLSTMASAFRSVHVMPPLTSFTVVMQENIHRNFGMPQPNGYRKALRFMKHADKFGLPIVTFVDTPGAFAGKSAEESGQVLYQNLSAWQAAHAAALPYAQPSVSPST